MKLTKLLDGLYELKFGISRAFILEDPSGLVFIDTGIEVKEQSLARVLQRGGLTGMPVSTVLLTHLHSDHTGNLGTLARGSTTKVYAHRLEADAIEQGQVIRPSTAPPTFFHRLVHRLVISSRDERESGAGTPVDRRLEDGDELDLAGGITALHTPGHTAGHCSYLWQRHGGVLFVGDAASGAEPPGFPMLFEDETAARRSVERLGAMTFDRAYFCHGRHIEKNASAAFAGCWDGK